jgi:hypothetical protein
MMMLKRGYRLRDGDQVPTRLTTVAAMMAAPTFALGVADARAGRRYHRDYDLWDVNGQWDYERGRQWAVVAPRHVALKVNGKINLAAMTFYSDKII